MLFAYIKNLHSQYYLTDKRTRYFGTRYGTVKKWANISQVFGPTTIGPNSEFSFKWKQRFKAYCQVGYVIF